MYPMTDPRRKSLRGAPWDGPSLTCYKKRSPNMGTKTCHLNGPFDVPHKTIKKDPQTWGRKPNSIGFSAVTLLTHIKKDPQTWGRKPLFLPLSDGVNQ